MSALFFLYPDWQENCALIDQKSMSTWKLDNDQLNFVNSRTALHTEERIPSPTRDRDKHTNGVAGRSVAIATKINIAMMEHIKNPCLQTFSPETIIHASDCEKLFFYLNQRHIHLKYLHPFWTPHYFTILPYIHKVNKLGQARAWPNGCFVGCQ